LFKKGPKLEFYFIKKIIISTFILSFHITVTHLALPYSFGQVPIRFLRFYLWSYPAPIGLSSWLS